MRAFFLGLAVLAAVQAPALAGERQFQVSDQPVLDDHYPAQVAKWPGGVTSLADVTYSTIPGYRPMVVDIYMPPKKGGPKPLVLYIYESAFRSYQMGYAAAQTIVFFLILLAVSLIQLRLMRQK